MEKNKLTVSIGNREFNIVTDEAPEYVDVLVDGEFHMEERDVKLQWKGSANQRVIDVPGSLAGEDPSVPVLHCGSYGQEYREAVGPGGRRGCCS